MRFFCWFCGKSVTNEVGTQVVIRAICVCPECIENGRIIITDTEEKKDDVQDTKKVSSE